jgi:glucokinase
MKKKSILAIDLGGTNIRFGLVDRSGRILRRHRAPMPAVADRSILCRVLAERILSFLERSRNVAVTEAVAIGFAGLTMAEKGYVYFAPNISRLSDIELGPDLAGIIGMPVQVENDANCAALGEYWRGAGMGVDSLFLFTLGTGVGGGLVVGGRLWDGHDGIAGEVGHTIIDLDGPRCGCGNRGCLEALASATAVVREYRKAKRLKSKRAREAVTARAVVQKARQGEPAAVRVISAAARALGTGIANVYNLINPELILIGGGLSRAGSLLIGPATRCAREIVPAPLRARIRVKRAKLGDDAGLLGAAYLAYTGGSGADRRAHHD